MTDIWDRWTRALASIVALIVLLVALPAALLAAAEQRFGARNPLARVEPPWNWSIDTIVGTLTQRLSDATIVDLLIRACLVTIWIAILVIVLSIAIEVAHLLRHGLPSPRIRGFGWAQGFSRWVAAGLISAVPLVSMVSTAAPVSASSPAATSQRWFPVGVAQPAHVMPGDAFIKIAVREAVFRGRGALDRVPEVFQGLRSHGAQACFGGQGPQPGEQALDHVTPQVAEEARYPV